MVYHSMKYTCNGFIYSYSAALLDLEKPWKILYRTSFALLAPHEIRMHRRCAQRGFPLRGAHRPINQPDGDLVADMSVCLACARVDEQVDYIKTDSTV